MRRNKGLKKFLPILLLLGAVGAGGSVLIYKIAVGPNPAIEWLSGSAGEFGGALSYGKNAADNREDHDSLPHLLKRAQVGQQAASQYSDVNYGESSLNLVGGELPLKEAMDMQGGAKPFEEDGVGGAGSISQSGLTQEILQGLSGSGRGGFDRGSALDETAAFYASKGAGIETPGKSSRGKRSISGGAGVSPLLASAAGRNAGAQLKGVGGSMGRAQKLGAASRANFRGGNSSSKGAVAQLKNSASFATANAGRTTNFQTRAGAMGVAMDGMKNAEVLDGIRDVQGVSSEAVPEMEGTNAANPHHQNKKKYRMFEWNPVGARLGKLEGWQQSWSNLGNFAEVYGETVGLASIVSQYLGFVGVVVAPGQHYSQGAFGSMMSTFSFGVFGGDVCNRSYSSYVEVTEVEGKPLNPSIKSRASPWASACHHKGRCRHAPSVNPIETIPFGEGRFLLIYEYYHAHSVPNPALTGFLMNLNNVKSRRDTASDPMFVPLNASAAQYTHLGNCLRRLADDYAQRCNLTNIKKDGLLDEFTEKSSDIEGGIRGSCVEYYRMPRRFERCVKTGRWSPL